MRTGHMYWQQFSVLYNQTQIVKKRKLQNNCNLTCAISPSGGGYNKLR
jgi:hypothetical protein